MPCACSGSKALLFAVIFILSFSYLYLVYNPSAERYRVLLTFIFVEVNMNLFVANAWLMIPIVLVGRAPKVVWYILFSLLSLGGWINALRFYYYYFFSVAYPALAQSITSTVPPQAVWFFPICTVKGGCDILKDLHVNLMTKLWWDDCMFLIVITLIMMVVEGVRYKVRWWQIAGFMAITLLGGVDTVAPVWILFIRKHEIQFATRGWQKRDIGSMAWLYFIITVGSVAVWLPSLLFWAETVGTVAGQLEAGLVSPAGARASLAIMNAFFTWAVYFLADTSVSVKGVLGFVLTWFLRFAVFSAHEGHMAGAVAICLLYRELTPAKSLVPQTFEKPLPQYANEPLPAKKHE